MIDIERWVLSEAWIANGLRMRYARGYEQPPASGTFGDNVNFWYAGGGEWVLVARDAAYRPYGDTESPTMTASDMRHELAHWLTATAEERQQVNFGGGDEIEQRAVAAERVLSSIIGAAARIAGMALAARQREGGR